MKRKLRRIIGDDQIFGLCAGMAYWLGIPTWVVRVVWLATLIYYGIGLVPYIILSICIPRWDKDPDDYRQVTG